MNVVFFAHDKKNTQGPRGPLYEFNAVTNPFYIELARSTAVMVSKEKISYQDKSATLSANTLGDQFRLCKKERFREQPMVANCSGTLVAPDIILTAGHCYPSIEEDCKNYAWVFDYKAKIDKQTKFSVPKSHVYKCAEVLLKENNLKTGEDFALIRPKTKVEDRLPAKLSSGTPKEGTPLVLIGHPHGLPTKVADDARVLKVNNYTFNSNLDAFSSNSGSGVFNAESGELEGVMGSGLNDYDYIFKKDCRVTAKYKMEKGGEIVVKLNRILDSLKIF